MQMAILLISTSRWSKSVCFSLPTFHISDLLHITFVSEAFVVYLLFTFRLLQNDNTARVFAFSARQSQLPLPESRECLCLGTLFLLHVNEKIKSYITSYALDILV